MRSWRTPCGSGLGLPWPVVLILSAWAIAGCVDRGDRGRQSRRPPAGFNGVWQTKHDNGQLASEHTYLNGQRKGPFTTWYPNGQKASEGTLLKSVPYDDAPGAYENTYDGLLLEWYEDGKLKARANYAGGVLHGRREVWGNIHGRYWKSKDEHYRQGKLHGVCTRWDTGVRIVSDYRTGKLHGRVRGYSDPGGQLKYEYWYKDDKASEPFDLPQEATPDGGPRE